AQNEEVHQRNEEAKESVMPKKTANGLDIKQLFKNKKDFADDLTIDLGNGATMTLGDLRAYDVEMGGELQAQMQRDRDALEKERGKVSKAAEEVAQLYLKVEEEKKALSNHSARQRQEEDPFAALEGDPLAKVLKGFMDEVRGDLKSTKD